MTQSDHYINGRWAQGVGSPLVSINPATGVDVWSGHAATEKEVGQAVAAARQAFPAWADTPLDQRQDHVRAFAAKLSDHKEEMAETISRDTGKPLWESRTEVGAMIGKVELSIQAYRERRAPATRPLNNDTAVTRFKPHGVCAVFGPFNLPGHLPNGHIIPALIAGNTVVFKPSEQAAAVGHLYTQIWHDVGLPPGVLNTVQGARDTGVALAQHPELNGLFFTGSYATGLALSSAFVGHTEKILALEMGGNNPLVVWDAADLDAAAYLTVQSAYITAGQRCSCARRLIIPDNDDGQCLIDRLVAMIATIRVGPYTDQPEPFMGPVISPQAAQQLLNGQETLTRHGAKVLVEMTAADDCPSLLSPGLVDATCAEDLPDEELFGPFLQVMRVPDFDAAITQANRTAYGLSAALVSDRKDLYEQFNKRVRAGVINWNRQTTGASGALPFGGVGHSGNHRPSGYYAADYCSYPVASIEVEKVAMPDKPTPGIGP